MLKRVLLGVGCGWLLGCGAPAAKPATEPQAAPSASAVAAPVVATRGASAEVRKYWHFGKHPMFALYADLQSLFHTEVGQNLVPMVQNAGGDSITPAQLECLRVFHANARSLTVAASKGPSLTIVEVNEAGEANLQRACVGNLLSSEPRPFPGVPDAYAMGEARVAFMKGGILLIGSPAQVSDAVASAGSAPDAFPDGLELTGDEHMRWRAENKTPPLALNGNFRMASDSMSFTGTGELPNEQMAEQMEAGVATFRAQALGEMPPEMREPMKPLLDAIHLKRTGKHIDAALEVKGGATQQALVLGTVAGIAVTGVRKYMVKAKSAEAHVAMGQIAKSYAAYWYGQEDAPGANKKKPPKLFSLPAVPAAIPRGAKYQTSPDEWKAWSRIQFTFEGPQYYQYEVIAAKDGKTATVVARGDLDGDGKASEFRLRMYFDKTGALLLDPDLQETDPEE